MEQIVFRPQVLGALVFALMVVIAGCGGQGEGEGGPERVGTEVSLPASFALLQTPGVNPPQSVKARLAASFGPHQRTKIVASYRMDTPLGAAWMLTVDVPSAGAETCLVMVRSSLSSCAPAAIAKRTGLAIGLSATAGPPPSNARRFTVMGVVPDWVRSVVVTPLDGRAEVLRVTSNAFSDQGPAPILIKKYCRGVGLVCVAPGQE